jgi:hypothetical protein
VRGKRDILIDELVGRLKRCEEVIMLLSCDSSQLLDCFALCLITDEREVKLARGDGGNIYPSLSILESAMVAMMERRDDGRILHMFEMIVPVYSMLELDICGAFQKLVRGRRVAAEWGHAKLNG